jgi:glycosyltransferase involved in cell wall biosynthesis
VADPHLPPNIEQRPYILCVCRHVAKKGVDTLLRAFAQVARTDSAVSLVLLGDGPLFGEHKTLAGALGIESRVAFIGNVDHSKVSPFFAACTVFVLPSRDEPFGLVLLEAASHKRAIVCTRVGGVPEIVADGLNGLVVEADDVTGMAAAIVNLLREPQRRAALGAAAFDVLKTRFLWKERIQDYIAVFEGRPLPRLVATTASPGPGLFKMPELTAPR